MKFIVEHDPLKAALAIVGAQSKGANIPILEHILIETGENQIKMAGHNLDSCSQVTVPAEIHEAGAIAVPTDRVVRLVAGLAKGSQVTFSTDGTLVKLRCGRSAYQFGSLPAADFPEMLSPKEPVKFTLTAKQTARLFKAPAPCISTEQSRIYLNGIFLHVAEKRLAACATNGHTLLRVFVDVKPPAFEGVIVPDKSCAEIARVVGDDEAQFQVSPNLIAVEARDRRFVSKIIDATFPDYLRVIPQATAVPITIDSGDLESALARLHAAKDEKTAAVVRLAWANGVESLSATVKSEYGAGEEKIECDCPGGRNAGEVGAQVDYLRALVEAMGGERTKFYIDDPGSPIRIENPDDADIVSVCMPCRF